MTGKASVDAELFQSVAQGAEGHAQAFGGGGAVPAGFFQGLLDQLALDAFQIIFQVGDAGVCASGVSRSCSFEKVSAHADVTHMLVKKLGFLLSELSTL